MARSSGAPRRRGRAVSFRIRVKAFVGALALDVELAGDDQPLALVGPNGSGKTTLLRMVAGAVKPNEGEIEIAGEVVFDSTQAIDVPSERRHVGYLPQGYGLFPHLRVVDNVAFGLSTGPRKKARAERRAIARRLLAELDCLHLQARLPRHLSGGEQQRVALARALAVDPSLLLLDEPLAALDIAARRAVRSFLAERLRTMGRPSIFVTHDVRDVHALEATVCVLDAGGIVQRGTPEELRAAPATDFVAEFVGL